MEHGKRPQTKEQRLLQVNSRLKNENAKLRKQIKEGFKERDEKIAFLEEKLEKALLYIEQLQKIVFRGKRGKDEDNDDLNNKTNSGKSSNENKRSKSSYRRPTPNKDGITNTEIHNITHCPDCRTKLARLKMLEFYEEDIAPIMEWYKNLKKVTKKIITTGYCAHCAHRKSALPIPKQKVSLGKNIRDLIIFQLTVQQLTHSQIIDFFLGCLNFKISKGEILKILEDEARKLKPAFEDLKAEIRGQPGVHIDETGWKTNEKQIENYGGNYAWVTAGTQNNNVLYLLGRTRGGGNIDDLLGNDFDGVAITDDYRAYKNAFKKSKHALCWAHPERKIRDLSRSDAFSIEKKKQVKCVRKKFHALYKDVREVALRPYDKQERLKEKQKLMKKFMQITEPHKLDPFKLKTIKNSLREQSECYFICITEPDISPDNNKAERALRHLVIKRKKSFGSKNQKGADILSVVYSVVMSLWYDSKENFFSNYSKALNPASGI